MSRRADWERVPDGDGWVVPSTRADLIEELDLCGVPLDAPPQQAAVLIELQGVWANSWMLQGALAKRREQATLAAA